MNSCPHCHRPYDTYICVGGTVRQRIFDHLRTKLRGATMDELANAAYYDRPDGGPLEAKNVICVTICQLNKILALHGLRVRFFGGTQGGRYKLIEYKAGALHPPGDGLSRSQRGSVSTSLVT